MIAENLINNRKLPNKVTFEIISNKNKENINWKSLKKDKKKS